jgi:hypothetical protein
MPGTNRAHLLTSRKPVVFKSDSFFQAFVVRLSFSAPLPSEVRGGGSDRSWPLSGGLVRFVLTRPAALGGLVINQ